ncbi:MAG: family 16 glycosylhydrolase [Clostridia bacterium]|nr:family 16 glycosylhydrolase [Clostridia bacterium]
MKKVISVIMIILMLASSVFVLGASAATTLPVLGDVNEDGSVDASDLLSLKRYVLMVMTMDDDCSADISGDTAVNATDLLLLKRSVLSVTDLDETLNGKLGMNKQKIGDKMVSPLTYSTYKLVFIDDFKGTKLNTSYWSTSDRNANQMEEQVNRAENVVVENDNLIIWGKKENQQYTGGAESWETPKTSYFTGGYISTANKKSYQYGRLEIRCKVPYSYGMWPAFWTVGTQRGWPWGGEIDIMEFVGGTDQWNNYRDDEYNSGIHWCDPTLSSSKAWSTSLDVKASDPDSVWNRTDTKMSTGGKYEIPNSNKTLKIHDEWHVCGVEWTDSRLHFYMDDKLYLNIDITKTSMREAFHQPHHMILNLAMGGSWAGTPDEAKGTVWPQKFEVDWVKVWQKS